MKVLITGNRGFVGAATQSALEASGHQVVGFDIQAGLDITNRQQLEEIVSSINPDRILHLCAVARFSDADANPLQAFEVNVIGTQNVAEVASKYGIPVVHASTGSVYMPIKQEMPITEDFPIAGNSIYGCSKVIAEKYIQRMRAPWMILRYGHLYGAEKHGHGLIGGYLDAIWNGRNPKLFGGGQTNDFMYINDVVMANVHALEWSIDGVHGKGSWNQIYNIGTGVELSAKDAGDIVCDVFGYNGTIDIVPQRSVDPDRFVLDCDKAALMLDFRAQYSFADGLADMKRILEERKAA